MGVLLRRVRAVDLLGPAIEEPLAHSPVGRNRFLWANAYGRIRSVFWHPTPQRRVLAAPRGIRHYSSAARKARGVMEA